MTSGQIVGIIFILIIALQVYFAIRIKVETFKLRRKNQITEKDALRFLGKMRLVLWVPNSTKYYGELREAYHYIYNSPLVMYNTKIKVNKCLRFRLVKGIPVPKKY